MAFKQEKYLCERSSHVAIEQLQLEDLNQRRVAKIERHRRRRHDYVIIVVTVRWQVSLSEEIVGF